MNTDKDQLVMVVDDDEDLREMIALVLEAHGYRTQAAVDGIIEDCLGVPFEGAVQNKEALNTSLEIMGVGALFLYHGQMNALGRLRERRPEDDGFDRFRGQ